MVEGETVCLRLHLNQTNGDEAKLNLLLFELTPSLLYFIPLFSGTWPPLFFFFFVMLLGMPFFFFGITMSINISGMLPLERDR